MVQQLQTAACVLIVLFAGIGTTAVALRLWARFITKKWGLGEAAVFRILQPETNQSVHRR